MSIEPANLERDLRPLAIRYMGPEAGARYVAARSDGPADAGDILVKIRPERWLSEDYSRRQDLA